MSYPRYRRSRIHGEITEAKRAEIAQQYRNGMSFETIRVTYGMAFGRVKKMLEDAGIEARPAKLHTINETYFDVIYSHEKAYFVGLIMADGCVQWNRPKTHIGKLTIGLHVDDGYILEHFAKAAEYTGPVREHFSDGTGKGSYGPHRSHNLGIYNARFVSPLARYGLSPAKSVDHPFFSNIPDEYLPSAILGYFDGDGSVSFHRTDNNRLSASFICSVTFANALANTIKAANIPCSVRIRKTKGGKLMGEVRLKGNRCCLELYRFMYQANVPSLKRKREKFEWVLEQQKLGKIKDTSTKGWERKVKAT